MVSFAVKKLLSLIRSHLFILVFVSFAFENKKKSIASVYVKECSPLFLLEVVWFQVLHLGV